MSLPEPIRTNDIALISMIEGLLREVGIPYQVADRNMSVLEGSIMAIQIRILPEDYEAVARQLLIDADLGNWLRPEPGPTEQVTRSWRHPRRPVPATAAEERSP